MTENPFRVVVAGGGVAGLEALLALRALGADRVALTLVSPTEDFVVRPLAVGRAFARSHARRTPLREVTRDVGADFVHAAVAEVHGPTSAPSN